MPIESLQSVLSMVEKQETEHPRFRKNQRRKCMNTLELFFIAVGLSMDAFAVAICKGLCMQKFSFKRMVTVGLYFGIFQAGMPLLGYFLGSQFESYITNFDHWIAFLLLGYVGGKMIRDSFDTKHKEYSFDPSKGWNLVLLSFATSIDALAVGLGLALIDVTIWYPAFLIGIITAGLSLIGILMGYQIGQKFGKKVELFGGLVLLFIGFKIVLEHTLF